MDDVGRAGRKLVHRLAVEHVRLVQGEVRVVGERRPREGVPVEVVRGDDLVLVHKLPGEGGGDEACTARDEDPFALEHAASLPARYRTSRHAERPADRRSCGRRGLRRRPERHRRRNA